MISVQGADTAVDLQQQHLDFMGKMATGDMS